MPPPAGHVGPAWQLTVPAPLTEVTSRQQILLSEQSAASSQVTMAPAHAPPVLWQEYDVGLES
jgi:hypothetical protein